MGRGCNEFLNGPKKNLIEKSIYYRPFCGRLAGSTRFCVCREKVNKISAKRVIVPARSGSGRDSDMFPKIKLLDVQLTGAHEYPIRSRECTMVSFNLRDMLPFVSFFEKGRISLGVMAFLMQLTIVLWPLAAHMARGTDERFGVEKLLDELSDTHRAPAERFTRAPRKFRQMA